MDTSGGKLLCDRTFCSDDGAPATLRKRPTSSPLSAQTCQLTSLRQENLSVSRSTLGPHPPSVPRAMLRAKWTINDNCLDFLDERRFRCNNFSGACVDAKPRGIEATRIVSGGRGTKCVRSYWEQQKPRRRPANEAVMILCVRVYESAARGTVQSDSLVFWLSQFPNYLVFAPLNTVESYCLLWIPN